MLLIQILSSPQKWIHPVLRGNGVMAIIAEVNMPTMSRPLEVTGFGSGCWVCFRKTCAWHHNVTARFFTQQLWLNLKLPHAPQVLCLVCRSFFQSTECRKCLKILSRAQHVYLDVVLRPCWNAANKDFDQQAGRQPTSFRWQVVECWSIWTISRSRLGRATACAQRRVLWPCSQQARQEGCNFHCSELTTSLTWIVHVWLVEARFE